MFKKIVVGLDGSKASETGLRLACDLAQKYKAKVHLVYTTQVETVAYDMGVGVAAAAARTELDAAGVRVLEEGEITAKEYGLKSVETHLAYGNSADEILHCVENCNADLIVTGRRGLGIVTGILIGSTSQRISHLAKCAYLSVA
jgi:nucleotide-binding universal stress UspA family protein